jgi:ribonuclease G
MTRKILINVDDTDLRVAFLEDGKLVGLQIEPYDEKSIVGNLYKARVEGIVPGLKAVFVGIGTEKNAFLHFSDIHSRYSLPSQGRPTRLASGESQKKSSGTLTVEPSRPKRASRSKKKGEPPLLEVGDQLLVQVTKEEINDKGPRVTTNISLPGRYLVYLPSADKEGGVSRRIEDNEERKRLRSILKDIKAPEGAFIVRTAGLDQAKEAITADVRHLQSLWRSIERKSSRAKAPSLIHNDHDIIFRLVRDSFAGDEKEVLIDNAKSARDLQGHIKRLMPESGLKAKVYSETQAIFDRYDVERQIQRALRNKVWLKSGGSLIIEETEAMTAIDVNTGKYVGRGDQEEAILRTNLEAASEVVQQLRIRDIGGIIVVDFIDMGPRKNRQELVREMGRLLKEDRAKSSHSDVSEFGIIQITRKRVRQSLSKTVLSQCPYCSGTGRVLSHAQIWKSIKSEVLSETQTDPAPTGLEITVHPDIRKYLEENLLESIRQLANRHKITLTFISDGGLNVQVFNTRRCEEPAKKAVKQSSNRAVTPKKSVNKDAKRTRRGGRSSAARKKAKETS